MKKEIEEQLALKFRKVGKEVGVFVIFKLITEKMDDLLYRGINPEQFQVLLSKRILEPKGNDFSILTTFNGDFKFDGTITSGHSQRNAIAGHQNDSNKYKTSGISTTPHWHRAVFYALNEYKNELGYVLTFAKSVLLERRIEFNIVSNTVVSPKIPEDDEVILHTTNNESISIDSLELIEEVNRNGSTKKFDLANNYWL